MEPVRIQFLEMPPSDAVAAKIRQRAERLVKFCPEVLTCDVRIDSPHGHHRKGPLYRVHLKMNVPGEDITIERQPEQEDVFVSVREAFDAARRKLEDYERRRRGDTKTHPRATRVHARRRQAAPRVSSD